MNNKRKILGGILAFLLMGALWWTLSQGTNQKAPKDESLVVYPARSPATPVNAFPPAMDEAAPTTKIPVLQHDDEEAEATDLPDASMELYTRNAVVTALSSGAIADLCLSPWAEAEGIDDEFHVDYTVVLDGGGLFQLSLSNDVGLPEDVEACVKDVLWAMPASLHAGSKLVIDQHRIIVEPPLPAELPDDVDVAAELDLEAWVSKAEEALVEFDH